MKKILFFLLLTINLYSQVIVRAPVLSTSESFASTFAQGTTTTDSLLLWVSTRSARIDSLVLSSNLSLTANTEQIAEYDRLFYNELVDGDFSDTTQWNYTKPQYTSVYEGVYQGIRVLDNVGNLTSNPMPNVSVGDSVIVYVYLIPIDDPDYDHSGTLYIDMNGGTAQNTGLLYSNDYGWYTFTFNNIADNQIRFYGGGFDGYIKNVIVRKVSKSHNWVNNGDTRLFFTNDSLGKIDNIPVELNPNPNFDNWSYTELVTNGDFSDWTHTEVAANVGFENYTGTQDDGTSDVITDWSNNVTSGYVDATATVHEGSSAIKFVNNSGSSYTTLKIYDDLVVTASTPYKIEFYTRGDGVNGGYYNVYDLDNSAYIINYTATGVSGTSYQRVEKIFKTPVGCTNIRVQIAGNDSNGSIIYYDSLSIVSLSEEPTGWDIIDEDDLAYVYESADYLGKVRQVSLDGDNAYLRMLQPGGLDSDVGDVFWFGWTANNLTGNLSARYGIGTSNIINTATYPNGIVYEKDVADDMLYFSRNGITDVVLDDVSLKELVAPDGWTASTMTETEYVIEHNNGLKFVCGSGNMTIYLDVMEVGKTYAYSITIDSITTSKALSLVSGVSGTHLLNSTGVWTGSFVADGTNFAIGRNNINMEAVISNVTLTELNTDNYIELPVTTTVNQGYRLSFDAKEGATLFYQTDWSADADSYTATNGTVSGNNDNISDGNISFDNVLKYYADATDGQHRVNRSFGTIADEYYAVTGWYYIPSENSTLVKVSYANDVQEEIGGSRDFDVRGSWQKIYFVYKANGYTTRFYGYDSTSSITWVGANSSSDDIVYFYDIKLYHLDDVTQSVQNTVLAQFGYYEDGSFVTLDSVRTDTLTQTMATTTDNIMGSGDKNDYYVAETADNNVTFTAFSYDSTDAYSFELYFQAKDRGGSTDDYYLLGNNGYKNFILFRELQSGTDYIMLENWDDISATRYYEVGADNWVHFVMTYDGQGNLAMYGDGDSLTGGAYLTGWDGKLSAVDRLWQGYAGGNDFQGNYQIFRRWNTALTSAQCSTLYANRNVTSSWITTPLSDSLKIDLNGMSNNISASTWTDASGNNDDGTVTNATPFYNPRFRLTLSDTGKAIIDNFSLLSITDSFVVAYPDTIVIDVTADISSLGTFNESIIVYGTFSDSPDTQLVNYAVSENYILLVQDTLDFNTVSSSTSLYLTLSNPSDEPIGSISFSGYASPFSISETFTTLSNGIEDSIKITFNASVNGSYSDDLIITSTADNSPDTVHLTGVWQADTIVTESAEWIAGSPGGGGWFRRVRIDDVSGRMHAVSDLSGHVYSDDNGLSWVQSSGLGTYECSSLDVLPGGDTVLVGSSAGIYRSVDGGETFVREGDNEIYPPVNYASDVVGDTIAFGIGAINYHPANSQIVYAGSGWNHDIERVGPDPCKIYKSTDGGATWSNVTTSTIQSTNNAVGWFSGSYQNENIVYAATRTGVYKSINGGTSWTTTGRTSNTRCVAVHPTKDDTVFAVHGYWSGGGVYRSFNGGTSFTDVFSNIGALVKAKELWFSSTGDTLYLSGDNEGAEVYMTTDFGNTWVAAYTVPNGNRWDGSSAKATSFDISPDFSKVILCDDANIYVSTNYGSTWYNASSEKLDNGYWKGRMPDVLVTLENAYNPFNEETMITMVSDHGLILSRDGGYSWTASPAGDLNLGSNFDPSDDPSMFQDAGESSPKYNGNAGRSIAWNPSDSSIVYVMVGDNDPEDLTLLFKSTDGGENWTRVVNNLPIGNYGTLVMNSSGRLFTAGYTTIQTDPEYTSGGSRIELSSSLFYSDNGGVTWTSAASGHYWTDIAIFPANESIMYASRQAWTGTNQAIAKSTNSGVSWTYPNNYQIGTAMGIAVHPTNSNYLYVASSGSGNGGHAPTTAGIYRSYDGGANWTLVLSPDSSSYTKAEFTNVEFDPSDASVVYASMGRNAWRQAYNVGDGIKMSLDSGATWTSINYNLERKSIDKFTVTPSGKIFTMGPGTGSYMLNKIAPTVPTISNFVVTGDDINQEIDATVNFSSTAGGEYAYVDIRTNPSNLFDGADDNYIMTVAGNQATYTFQSIDTSQTWYLQSIVGNNIGRDTSAIDSVIFNTGVAVVDTFYPGETWDDVYRQWSGSLYGTFEYNNIGYNTSSGVIGAGIRFRGLSDFSSIDSAKIEFTSWNEGTGTLDVTIWGEDNSNPAIFTNATDFDARVTTTDSSTAFENYTTVWADGSTYQADVTAIVQELYGSYTYSSGNCVFLILGKVGHSMSTNLTRTFTGYEYNSGSEKAKLIIWGTQ